MAVDFTAIFKAQDKVSKELGNINKQSSGLTSTFKKLAGAAAGVFTVTKIVEFGKESVSAFTTFENGMNEVFTLLPNISEKAMDEMTGQVKDFSKEFGVLPDKAVPALYQALSAGVPQDNVFSFLETANRAAIGGVSNIETAVDGLSSVVNAYGGKVIDADKASDLMFTTVRLGKTNFEELSASLFNVTPTAAAAGVSFDDVSAALAAMTAQGVPTSVATTQLRQAFVELSKSGTSTDKVFRQVAGKGFKEFIAEGNNTQDAFRLLEKHAEKTGLGINDLFGSVEAGGAALMLTGEGSARFSDALTAMAESGGATEKAFLQMERGFARTIEKFKAKVDVLKIEVGEKLVNQFWKMYDVAAPIFDKLKQGVTDIGKIFKKKGFSGGIEQLFGADVGSLAKMAESYAKAFLGGIQKIFTGDIAGGFSDILSAMGFDDTSIGTMMTFFDNIKTSLFDLVDVIKPLFATIKDAFISILPTLTNVMNFFTQKLLPIFQNVFGFVVESVVKPFVAMFQDLIPKIAITFNNLWTVLEPIFWLLSSAFGFVLEAAKPFVTNIMSIILALTSGIWTALDGLIQFLSGVFTGNWAKAWSGIVALLSGIWQGVATIFKAPFNAMINGINLFLSGLNLIKIPDWVPAIGGASFNLPMIPMLAKGSKDAPNTFIAGERGPELITGARGSRVFPSDDTGRILSAISSQNQPINTSYISAALGDAENGDTEKTFTININGSGQITASGLGKEEVLELLIVNLKPMLMKIIQSEIFEEGKLAYDY